MLEVFTQKSLVSFEGSVVSVHFHSDSSMDDLGFSITWSAEPGMIKFTFFYQGILSLDYQSDRVALTSDFWNLNKFRLSRMWWAANPTNRRNYISYASWYLSGNNIWNLRHDSLDSYFYYFQHNLDCEWIIRVPRGDKIKVQFLLLDIESHQNCV